jgi:hypothetical protein
MRNRCGTETRGRPKAILVFFQLVQRFEIANRKWGKLAIQALIEHKKIRREESEGRFDRDLSKESGT